jgi:hypothetical protein
MEGTAPRGGPRRGGDHAEGGTTPRGGPRRGGDHAEGGTTPRGGPHRGGDHAEGGGASVGFSRGRARATAGGARKAKAGMPLAAGGRAEAAPCPREGGRGAACRRALASRGRGLRGGARRGRPLTAGRPPAGGPSQQGVVVVVLLVARGRRSSAGRGRGGRRLLRGAPALAALLGERQHALEVVRDAANLAGAGGGRAWVDGGLPVEARLSRLGARARGGRLE